MMGAKFTLVGDQDRLLEVDDAQVRITTKGGIFKAKREKVIPISQITSVEIKEPGMVRGYIQFSIAGQASPNSSQLSSIASTMNASKDENSVLFGSAMLKVAREIKAHVEAFRSQPSTTGLQASPADELRKLKGLLDDGILTQAEFDAKKKQLLGL